MINFRLLVSTVAALTLSFLSTLAFAGYGDYQQAMDASMDFSGAGPYISGSLGMVKPLNTTYKDSALDNFYELKSKWGMGLGGAFGYRFQQYRVELGIDYSKNDDDSITAMSGGTDQGTGSETGEQKATLFMLNGFYDINSDFRIKPFVGFGLGVAHLSHDFLQGVTIKESDNALAYQAIFGAGWKLSDQLRATVDYRFLGTAKGTFKVDTAEVKGSYHSHRINFGLTYFM